VLFRSSHCIGVAVSDSANGDFTPVHNRPLICPPAAATPRAIDPILDGKARRPRPAAIGAIDPSYANLDRKHYLVYKTDGRPSSIRIMRLNKNGLRPIGRSRQLLVNQHGVTENPVIFKRGSFYYMVTSEGDFAQCTYHTVVRRSRDLLSGWQDAPKRLLLSRGTTGICGPGGADVLRVKGRLTMYFHGWTCRPQPKACRPPFRHWDGREDAREPIRSLYAARLRWTRDGWPVRSVWVRGR
jgi:beta-xylosidase